MARLISATSAACSASVKSILGMARLDVKSVLAK
jgi:hypothetical protein